jgi:hypothetical protein
MIPDWLIYWIAIWTPLDGLLAIVLIIYYRRYWSVARALGLDAAPAAQGRMRDKKMEGPRWMKFK